MALRLFVSRFSIVILLLRYYMYAFTQWWLTKWIHDSVILVRCSHLRRANLFVVFFVFSCINLLSLSPSFPVLSACFANAMQKTTDWEEKWDQQAAATTTIVFVIVVKQVCALINRFVLYKHTHTHMWAHNALRER